MFSKGSVIGVIGSGAMGAGIAQVAAVAGENVLLYDADNSSLQKAKGNLQSVLNKLEEKGKIKSGEASAVFNRIHFAESLNEFSKYKIKNEEVLGTIRGVNETGKLIFEKENGDVLNLDNKEIVFVI